MTRLDIERHDLYAFTGEVEAFAARNLGLLRDIEHTLSWLKHHTRLLQAHADYATQAAANLNTTEGVIDADGSLAHDMASVQSKIEGIHQALIQGRDAARSDARLTEDDGIEAGYTDAIAAAADLHNALNTLRWQMGEHDFDAVPHTANPALVFSDPNKLEAYLLSL